MRSFALLTLAVLSAGAAPSLAESPHADTAQTPGDSNPGDVFRLPPLAFHANGGKVYDLVRDFGAVPDDGKDDTAPFRAAYDLVVQEMEDGPFLPPFPNDGNKASPSLERESVIVYIPNGTYDIRDTAIYSAKGARVWDYGEGGQRIVNELPLDQVPPGAQETIARLRLIGESRDKTIIRLADKAKGFGDAASPKPVVSFGKHTINNSVAYNEIRNLTIDSGRGNPGAIGLRFGGANSAGVHNVRVRSTDGAGAIGIAFDINPAIPLVTDVTVDGFDIGVWAKQRLNLPHQVVLDRVTLTNQKKAGMVVDGPVATINRLLVQNAPLPLRIRDGSSHVVLLNSLLQGVPSRSIPAVDLVDGFILARNVRSTGMGALVASAGRILAAGDHADEFVSSGDASIRGQSGPAHTLNLAAPDPSARPGDLSAFPDLVKDWAAPEDYDPLAGTPGHDSTEAVRSAFASGKPVVYFPKTSYYVTSTIDVPASVRNIQFLYSRFVSDSNDRKRSYLRIAERSDNPLVIEDYQGAYNAWRLVEQAAWRPVVLQHVTGPINSYANLLTTGPSVPLFFNSVTGLGKEADLLDNVTLYGRALNTESKEAINWTVPPGSQVWVLGFKTEGTVPGFRIEEGGTLEVLGGVANQFGHHSSPPRLTYGDCPQGDRNIACFGLVQNMGGRVSMSFASTRTGLAATGEPELIPIIIEDAANDVAIGREDLPVRPAPRVGAMDIFRDFRVPLWSSEPPGPSSPDQPADGD